MINCKNCNRAYEGIYCPDCGQKFIDHRFKLKDSIYWILASVFNFEKGFLFTTKQLILKPGEVANHFLNGITIRYTHPFRFLFIWATVAALISVYTNTFEEVGVMGNKLVGQSNEQIEQTRKMLVFLKQYMSLFLLSIVPLFSLGTYWIYKRKKFNYAEHLIIVSYGNATSMVIGIPINLMYLIADKSVMNILVLSSSLILFVVMGRIFSQVFKENIIVSMLKYFVSYLIGMLMLMILFAIVFIAYLFYLHAMGLPIPFKPPKEKTALLIEQFSSFIV